MIAVILPWDHPGIILVTSWDHPALATAGFGKATCEGNHPGIILPRQLAGAIILASSWQLEVGFAEKT